jgi:hypothetical protein
MMYARCCIRQYEGKDFNIIIKMEKDTIEIASVRTG